MDLIDISKQELTKQVAEKFKGKLIRNLILNTKTGQQIIIIPKKDALNAKYALITPINVDIDIKISE